MIYPARLNATLRSVGLLLATLVPASSSAQSKFTVIHDFKAGGDGANPQARLVSDLSGALYGTTYFGGRHGHGTVFRLKPLSSGAWTETILYSFAGGSDGSQPAARLLSAN